MSQVSRAARMATPSPRIIQLAKPRAPATLLEEWDPMPKPKPHVSDYNRLLHLASKQVPGDLTSYEASFPTGCGWGQPVDLDLLLPDLCFPSSTCTADQLSESLWAVHLWPAWAPWGLAERIAPSGWGAVCGSPSTAGGCRRETWGAGPGPKEPSWGKRALFMVLA